MILGETELSRRATEETLPLRDAFAVLFFVSVGMLFDPSVLIEQPGPLMATVAIIVLGKSLAAFLIVRAFGHARETAIAVSASLAQIGEFSFILAGLGSELGILPQEGRDLILAGAILSILLNPFLFALVGARGKSRQGAAQAVRLEAERGRQARREEHVLLVGYGRVGKLIAAILQEEQRAFILIEDQPDVARVARAGGIETIVGNATDREVLQGAGVEEASKLLIAIPEGFEGGVVAETARRLNPDLPIIARAHSDEEVALLARVGARHVVMGEREIATRMVALARELQGEAAADAAA